MELLQFANRLREIEDEPSDLSIRELIVNIFGDENVDIKIHRTFKSLWDDVNNSPPDIAGFGSYDWNYNLTIASIKKLKHYNLAGEFSLLQNLYIVQLHENKTVKY